MHARLGWRMRKGLIGRMMIPMPRWNRLRIQTGIVAGRMRTCLRRTGAWRMSSSMTRVALFAATDKDDAVLRRAVRDRCDRIRSARLGMDKCRGCVPSRCGQWQNT